MRTNEIDRSSLEEIRLQNLIPAGASLLNEERDPRRTSERYKTTDDLALVAELNKKGWYVSQYRQIKAHKADRAGYKAYMAIYRNFEQPEIAGEGVLTVVQTNSRDGTQSLALQLGFYRPSNDTHMLLGAAMPAAFKHHGDVPVQLNEILVDNCLAMVPILEERIKLMKKVKLTAAQINEFGREALKLRFPEDKYVLNSADVTKVRNPEDEGSSLWKVLCRVQESLIKATDLKMISRDGRYRKARPLTSITLEMQLNRGLYELAEKYLGH